MKRIKFLAFILVLSSFILYGEAKGVVLKSYNGNFQITLPNGWTATSSRNELNDVSDLEALNEKQGIYLMALIEAKEDFDLDLQGFNALIVDLNGEAYNTSLGKSIKTKVGSYDAYLNEFTTTLNGIKIHFWVYSIETPNYYTQLFIWGTQSDAKKISQDVQGIVDTYKELRK